MATLKQRKLLPLFIIIICIGLAYLLMVAKSGSKARPETAYKPPELPVTYAQPEARWATVSSQGTVRPKWQIDLVAEASGRVVRVADSFVSGGFFNKGEELLKIEPLEYQVALARSEAQVAQAHQQLSQERGQALLAQREWRELGNTEANELFLRKPQIAATEANLKVATAELEKAKQDLARTSLRAPFSGRILEANMQLGNNVGSGAMVGKAFSTEVMEVPLPLTSRQLGLVALSLHADAQVDIPVTFTVEVGGNSYQWQGQVVRTEASFDTQSRVVYAIAEVRGAYRQREDGAPPFAPGLFAKAELVGKQFADAIEVPRSAIYERDKLLTLDSDNCLQVTPVEIVQADSDTALVRGVGAGTPVLLKRPALLIHGMEITPLDDNETRQAAATCAAVK